MKRMYEGISCEWKLWWPPRSPSCLMGFAEGASRKVAQKAMVMVKEPLGVNQPFVFTQHLSRFIQLPK